MQHDPSASAGLPTLAIIGRGRVGGSLAEAAHRAGLDCSTAGRGEAAAASAAAGVTLLCVPDGEIASACRACEDSVPGFIGHVSGACGLGELAEASDRGARTFSLHPLQTIPDSSTDLSGVPAAISSGSDAGLELARSLAERLGMSPFVLNEECRVAYHAAASIASNFLVTLEESAAGLLESCGFEAPRELLEPLVIRSAANWAERGGEALTGPIARGDEETVERHREALADRAPELLPLYEALAERTRSLARAEVA